MKDATLKRVADDTSLFRFLRDFRWLSLQQGRTMVDKPKDVAIACR
jgi:hypothetical protein